MYMYVCVYKDIYVCVCVYIYVCIMTGPLVVGTHKERAGAKTTLLLTS